MTTLPTGEQTITDWGADSEYGVLTDALVCRPDHFRWLATSAISQATLDSEAVFDRELGLRQHAEMVVAYETAGVRCHFLTPDPALPYQVFARDSSAATPRGPVVLMPQQWWRRGEYVPVIDFYADTEVPLAGSITAAPVEGGDVMIAEPGSALIGYSESRTQEPGARQMAAYFEAEGWEVRIQQIPASFVHLDVLVAFLDEKLAAICSDVMPAGLIAWLRAKGFDLIEVPEHEAFELGVNAMSLGNGRVMSASSARTLNAAMRARGLSVIDPDLSVFTAGGGGAHCLVQALRRERVG
jgi:N-dimethylarginine dimethylaminohydrolase